MKNGRKLTTPQRKQQFLNSVKRNLPCVDCNRTAPYGQEKLWDFDHIDRRTKSISLSDACYERSWDDILEELLKCVVRCKECHRRKTELEQALFREGHFNIDFSQKIPRTLFEDYDIACEPVTLG